jgi:rhodanese-related sulfurtransferase/predicted transcriptional regulator
MFACEWRGSTSCSAAARSPRWLHGLDKPSRDLLNSHRMTGGARQKEVLFQAISVMGKAFASPVRLELLDLLAQAPRSVDALARATGQSNANISQHLQALHAAGMVTRERSGTSVRYEIAGETALRVWLALRDASASRLAEVERAARDYLGGEVQEIGRDELRRRLARGDVVLIDVRPSEEFEAGHIEGARSVPLEELEQRLADLPSEREIVAYCRGPFCAFAHEAVRRLVSSGRDARRLAEGWPEWRLETGSADHTMKKEAA